MELSNGVALSRSSARNWLRIAAIAIAMTLLAPDARSSGEGTPSLEAVEKVCATMRAALVDAPLSTVQLSRLAAEVANLRSGTGSGAPIITWQSEGIGGGFQRNLNAVDYLRLSKPFNRPWHRSTIRELRQASER